MSDLIKVALISGCFSVIVGALTLIGVIISNRSVASKERVKAAAERAMEKQRLDDRLDSIERKQDEQNRKLDEHNGYAEKFASTTESIVEMRNDIRWLKEKCNG